MTSLYKKQSRQLYQLNIWSISNQGNIFEELELLASIREHVGLKNISVRDLEKKCIVTKIVEENKAVYRIN